MAETVVATPPKTRFPPLLGGLTVIMLAVSGLIVLSPVTAKLPDRAS